MKKFLIPFIIGIVLMAIGTTTLIFEIGSFERVKASDILVGNTYGYRNETYTLKENENFYIKFEDRTISYEREYNDALKDRVKVTLPNGVEYTTSENTLHIQDDYNISYYGYHDGWEQFTFFLDGLKERKLYEMNYGDIVITTSYANRDRVIINSNDY